MSNNVSALHQGCFKPITFCYCDGNSLVSVVLVAPGSSYMWLSCHHELYFRRSKDSVTGFENIPRHSGSKNKFGQN